MIEQHPLPDDLVELIARRFRALSEPTRIKLLDRLRSGEASVQELTDLIGSSSQNISKHLGVLHRAGIVGRRKGGNFVLYSIADEGVFALCEDVCGSLRDEVEALRRVVAPSASGAERRVVDDRQVRRSGPTPDAPNRAARHGHLGAHSCENPARAGLLVSSSATDGAPTRRCGDHRGAP